MGSVDPLHEFERLASRPNEGAPPALHIAPKVMRRIRTAETAAERTLEFLAAACCVAAVAVTVVGLSHLSGLENPLERLFQLVPPIEL